MGVFDNVWSRPFAEALKTLDTQYAWIVHGSDGLDELSTTGDNQVVQLRDGETSELTIHPDDIGLPVVKIDDLVGGTPEQMQLPCVMGGAKNAYRDIVVLNAAGAFVATGHETDLKTAAERAIEQLIRCCAERAGQACPDYH